jgi:hypothetical protein
METKKIIRIEQCCGHPDFFDIFEIEKHEFQFEKSHSLHYSMSIHNEERKKNKNKRIRIICNNGASMQFQKEDITVGYWLSLPMLEYGQKDC